MVWYFFVETRGYTLEQITVIFDTPGLSWKKRRNMRGTGDFFAQSLVSGRADAESQDSSVGDNVHRRREKSDAVKVISSLEEKPRT